MRLYVGNVDSDAATVVDVQRLFSAHAKVKCVAVRAGHAFVDVDDGAGASAAVDALNNTEFVGRTITVEESKEPSSSSIPTSGPVTVYFTGLPGAYSWDALQQLVHTSGAPQSGNVNEPEDEHDGRRTGFVTFGSPEEAQKCVSSWDGHELEGVKLGAFIGLKAASNPRRPRQGQRPNAGADVLPFSILVPNRTAGVIIGKGGANIREIGSTSGSRIDVARREQHDAQTQERVVTIKGTPAQAASALGLILTKAREAALESAEQAEEDADAAGADALPMPVKLCVTNELVGHVIGKQGAHIKQIKEETGADVKVDAVDMTSAYFPTRIVNFFGTQDAVVQAFERVGLKLQAVSAMMAAGTLGAPGGVMNMGGAPMAAMQGLAISPAMGGQYPFMGGAPQAMGGPTASASERVIVHVENRLVGAVIGRSGSYIRQVMEQSGAHIRINSDAADESEDTAIRQCIVVGKPEAQFQAQQLIYKKLQEQEGITQAATRAPAIPFSIEVEVPEGCIGRLIGKGGSRIRQISDVSNTKLTVNRPEVEGSDVPTTVSIVGSFGDVSVAQQMIRGVVAQHNMN